MTACRGSGDNENNFKAYVLGLVLVLVLIGGGCLDVTPTLPPPTEMTVIAESEDGNAVLRVPEGEVPAGTVFSIEDISDLVPDGAIGPVYRLSPGGTLFDSQASLSIRYVPGELPAEVSGEDLAIARLLDGAWVAMNSSHDPVDHTLTMSLGVLSTFGLVAVDPDDIVSRSEIEATARDLYQALEAGQDVTNLIEDILGTFAPVLTLETDEDLIYELIDEAIPFFLNFYADSIAQGYEKGFMVTIESFFDSLNTGGIVQSDNMGLLSREVVTAYLYLNIVMEDFFSYREEFLPSETLWALVIALGQERAQEIPGDLFGQVWGDDFLDPLQFLLLTCAFHYAAVEPPTTVQNRPWLRWAGRTLARGTVAGIIGEIIGLPLTPIQAASAIMGASVVLNSYNINVEAEHSSLWRRCPHLPGPHDSTVTVDVSFHFVPANPGIGGFLDFITGGLPDNGPVAGKLVQWFLWPQLPDHGSLERDYSATNIQGQASTTYNAFDEVIPPEERGEHHTDSGRVEAVIHDLMGGKWSTLEKIVVLISPDIGKGSADIDVNYYGRDDEDNGNGDPSPNQKWWRLLPLPGVNL